MAKAKKETKKTTLPAKPAKETEAVEPFTDAHERCAFLDGLKKIVDMVGNVIEDIPQAWRHGQSITTETTD